MAAGTLLLLPVGLGDVMHQSWSSISVDSWAAFSFSTFLSAGVAFTLWYQGVKRLGVTRTVVYHYLVPFIAVLFAALFLGEQSPCCRSSAACIILLGVYLVQRKDELAVGVPLHAPHSALRTPLLSPYVVYPLSPCWVISSPSVSSSLLTRMPITISIILNRTRLTTNE